MREDIVSEVLHAVRLTGSIFFDVAASSPWVAEAPPSSVVAPLVMPHCQHVIEYHVITSGYGWAALLDSDADLVRLSPGSVIMFPQGDQHVLSSEPGMRADPDHGIFSQPETLSPPYYLEQFGDGPEEIRLKCGFLGCDLLPFNPLMRHLPRMIHISADGTRSTDWLGQLISAINAESDRRRVGASCVLSRLSELLFIEVIRCYAESLPDETSGWLAALNDPHVGRAIQLIHHHPSRSWTLDRLSREVGTSRTVLVSRFTARLGIPPMKYLTNWRMQLAAGLLASHDVPIARIAAEVGYESEAAFSRAFKRCAKVSPGTWRRHGARDGLPPSDTG